jgi:hypothetical protein
MTVFRIAVQDVKVPIGISTTLVGKLAGIGRRNYLVAGADSGGEYAAAICSLNGTAKLNGVDPGRSSLLEQHFASRRGDAIIDYPTNRYDSAAHLSKVF